jgi:hypothetical protein
MTILELFALVGVIYIYIMLALGLLETFIFEKRRRKNDTH